MSAPHGEKNSTTQNDKTTTQQPATASRFTRKPKGKSSRKERGTLQPEDYEDMCALLIEFGMTEILEKFKEAMSAWQRGDHSIQDVDEWANRRHREIEAQIMRHAERVSDFLKDN